MDVVFTICSNNYLPKAKTLGKSIKRYNPDFYFIIFLCDIIQPEVDYDNIADELILMKDIEPSIVELAHKYNVVELNTALKPTAFEFLFNRKGVNSALFLDPDVKVFDSLSSLTFELKHANILLTPHIYTPILYYDDKGPKENIFLNYGIYNLGFIAIKKGKESLRFLKWWKQHTYIEGYMNAENGIFVDQLPINLAPIFFKRVKILRDIGCNMAPWNLHERTLTWNGDQYIVNNLKSLKFYHFSAFTIDSNELPLHYYDRFKLEDLPELRAIYKEYNEELITAGYNLLIDIIPFYTTL